MFCDKILFKTFLYLFIYFAQKDGTYDSRKTSITQEWLFVESCPTLHWIAFLMVYRLVYNIRSHFNKLILVWSAYSKFTGKQSYRSEISITLQSNFIEITLRNGCSAVKLLHIFRAPLYSNTYGGLLLPQVFISLDNRKILL